MMEKKPKITGVPVGGPSLLMAFILLCLTTFAVISYLSALRDFRLSEKTAENVSLYYQADGQGEEVLAKIHRMVLARDSIEEIEKEMPLSIISLEKIQEGVAVSFDVPMQEDLVIRVMANVTRKADGVEVLSWKTENIGEYEDEMDIFQLPVFQ